MGPLQCGAVFQIIFWGMLLIFGRQRETGQANGRWQAVFIFYWERGGRERGEGAELPAKKCDLVLARAEQLWHVPEDGGLGRGGWARLHSLPLGTCTRASRTKINLLRQQQHPGLDLGTSWSCVAPPRLISITGHTQDAGVICGAVLHLSAVTCLSSLPSPHSQKKRKKNWLLFIHLFITQLMDSRWHCLRRAWMIFQSYYTICMHMWSEGINNQKLVPRICIDFNVSSPP